ncbi:MAG TPA: methyltransferase domain-containing protein [Terriglobia bacterium]|jgi:ubiquinone/menaquinone biosynthesis C-methylase UbiE
MNFKHREDLTEIMDDVNRPEHEFQLAYRELKVINERLGGIRAIERFLPQVPNLLILDVAAGGCDVSDALLDRMRCRVVGLDLNAGGLKLARRTWPVAGDALKLPFADKTFDVVMSSLFFHHVSNDDCPRVLAEMWRVCRRRVIVNDLHRHAAAYYSFRLLAALFSKSEMVKHDGPVSVRRAFHPQDLLKFSERAGVPARVHRSFPFRLVLVADR